MHTNLHPRSFACLAPATSPDGYIRLPLTSLMRLPFTHLFSHVDAEFLLELQADTVPAQWAGFCEWKSETSPVISIGWGWFIHSHSDRLILAPDAIRSNIMFIDACGYDLGSSKTASLLCTWLSTFDWQDTVSAVVRRAIAC